MSLMEILVVYVTRNLIQWVRRSDQGLSTRSNTHSHRSLNIFSFLIFQDIYLFIWKIKDVLKKILIELVHRVLKVSPREIWLNSKNIKKNARNCTKMFWKIINAGSAKVTSTQFQVFCPIQKIEFVPKNLDQIVDYVCNIS